MWISSHLSQAFSLYIWVLYINWNVSANYTDLEERLPYSPQQSLCNNMYHLHHQFFTENSEGTADGFL